ncbi:MAG: conjugative transfer ATPase [Gammaproteobacteria bacterium]|nr:conjugative transfer ATPase [Gammaproteobacteria bacterium]
MLFKKSPRDEKRSRFTRRSTDKPATRSRIRRMYEKPASFTNLLPWMEYLPEAAAFQLEDGVSVGALLELSPIGCETRNLRFMETLRDGLQGVLTEAIPEEEEAPWVVQFYLQDIPSFKNFENELEGYINPSVRNTVYTQHYLKMCREHLQQATKAGGLFIDESVTGGAWQGKERKVRCVITRRLNERALKHLKDLGRTPVQNLNETVAQVVTAFLTSGIQMKRVGGEAFYEWMFRWFNPRPSITDGDVDRFLEIAPYPGDENLPYGSDFTESLMFGLPHSDHKTGIWWFDCIPHRVISIQSLRKAPEIGHFSAERTVGDKMVALFDRFPSETVLAITFIIKPQYTIRNHIALVKSGAVGDSAESVLARDSADEATMQIARGNKIVPTHIAIYLKEKTEEGLKTLCNQIYAQLIANGLQPIYENADLLALDSYIRNLPMCYDVLHDKVTRRSRFVFSKHLANLLPFYGRSTGTGHPGLVFFNRGGELLTFDPLHASDRKKNAHTLILGPTGAGKSALMVYLMMQIMAVHRPRLFVIEAGNSFGLLGQYFKEHDITVHQVSLQPSIEVSLSPFADALLLCDKRPMLEVGEGVPDVVDEGGDEDENRDVLGELEIVARIMITGGETKENEKMSRSDRMLIRQAIVLAAETVRQAQKSCVLTSDLVAAFRKIGVDPLLPVNKRERLTEMADGMELFCGGLAGHFFNSPGKPWPDVDVTILDMGILAREGYEDQLTVAFIGMMSHINHLVEAHQRDERPTIVLTDEGHIITTNPLLAPYVVKITKMWRKLGAWFWIATQNLEDFPNASKRMLNMMEWWLCLVMPKEEVEHIARFKQLTEEQRRALLSARKEPGKFVEGVVLSDSIQALFRNVPPPMALALAMTEKHEKAERAELMRHDQCSELEAVRKIAERIRGKG